MHPSPSRSVGPCPHVPAQRAERDLANDPPTGGELNDSVAGGDC